MRLATELVRRRTLYTLLAIFVVLCGATILTMKPWCDEGYNASAAMNLVNHGYMGVSSVEEATADSYPGVNRHWYWQMPFYPVALAGWFEVTGQGIYQQRLFTLVQALVVLVSICFLLGRVTNVAWLGVATVAVLSVDYFFVQRSSDGRYDMLCASLGFAGLASYWCLRQRSGLLALLAGSTCIVGALMTHPVGALYAFQLLYLVLRYDFRRISWRWVAAALLPAVLAGLLWFWYIDQDLGNFRVQFFHSTADRALFVRSPLRGLIKEVKSRYLFGLGGIGDSVVFNPVRQAKAVVLVVYVAGLLFALFAPKIRAEWNLRPVMVLWGIAAVTLLVMDSGQGDLYLLHVLPWMAALLAASVGWLWLRFPARGARFALGGVAAVFLAVQLGGIGYVIRRDEWGTQFRPAVRYLQQNVKPADLVVAGPEMGFALGFGQHLMDDDSLGYFSGKTPTYIVLEPRYWGQINAFKNSQPAVSEFIARRLTTEYALVYNANSFEIYKLNRPVKGSAVN